MTLLVGDIGGTKALLATYEHSNGELVQIREQIYPSAQYASLEAVIDVFLEDETTLPEAACFGLPGPIIKGQCEGVNLPWGVIKQEAIISHTGIKNVSLLNDLQAAALGMLELDADQLVELNPEATSEPTDGNIAVLAAGTGLGEAILYFDGEKHHSFATEGGHSDFVCNCEADDQLLQFMRKRHQGHVSLERIISGPGLFSIYDFLRETDFAPQSEEVLEAMENANDPSAVIGQYALEGKDPLCEEALRMFVRLYGNETGNLALKCLALGGVYICGGIAPKILSAMQNGSFMAAFTDKGRLSPMMQGISVKVALASHAPLLGAARYAVRAIAG